ncbi:MAG: dihydroneopterin aldolase family protein [Thermoplasmata archaeon]
MRRSDRPLRRPPTGQPTPTLTTREMLLFEAGIKLGGIFHQYVGVPVAATTAPGLARAIADAVRLQPYVRSAVVRIHVDRAAPRPGGRFAYHYLTAEMLEATVTLADRGQVVSARVDFVPELRYPLMRVTGATARRRGPRASRTAR